MRFRNLARVLRSAPRVSLARCAADLDWSATRRRGRSRLIEIQRERHFFFLLPCLQGQKDIATQVTQDPPSCAPLIEQSNDTVGS